MPAFAELSFPSCPLNILHRLRYFSKVFITPDFIITLGTLSISGLLHSDCCPQGQGRGLQFPLRLCYKKGKAKYELPDMMQTSRFVHHVLRNTIASSIIVVNNFKVTFRIIVGELFLCMGGLFLLIMPWC